MVQLLVGWCTAIFSLQTKIYLIHRITYETEEDLPKKVVIFICTKQRPPTLAI